MFALQNAEAEPLELPGARAAPVASTRRRLAKFDLELSLSEEERRGLRGALAYSTDLSTTPRSQRMLGHLERAAGGGCRGRRPAACRTCRC